MTVRRVSLSLALAPKLSEIEKSKPVVGGEAVVDRAVGRHERPPPEAELEVGRQEERGVVEDVLQPIGVESA